MHESFASLPSNTMLNIMTDWVLLTWVADILGESKMNLTSGTDFVDYHMVTFEYQSVPSYYK